MSQTDNEMILKILKKIEKRLTVIENRLETKNESKVSKKKKTSQKIVKSGNINMTKYENACLLTGDTFDKKFLIKEFKGRWNPENKGWIVNLDSYEKLYEKLSKVTSSIEEFETDESIEGFVKKTVKIEKPPVNNMDYGFISDD